MARLLLAIFHHGNEHQANRTDLLHMFFEDFATILPTEPYYGGKFQEARKKCIEDNFDWLFIICSDVHLKRNLNWKKELESLISNPDIGVFGMPLRRDSQKQSIWRWCHDYNCEVPFADGYCIGISLEVLKSMPAELPLIGYGIDIAAAYTSQKLGKKVVHGSLPVWHEEGQDYSEIDAMAEMQDLYLFSEPELGQFYENIKSINTQWPIQL